MGMLTGSFKRSVFFFLFLRKFSSFDPEKLVSISADMSWAMWDLETQKIVKKIKLEDEVKNKN